MLPVENKHVGIYQKDFSIFNRNIAVADNYIPVCNLDIVQKMDGFCGQATECRARRPQVSVWQKQIFRPQKQFRVAGCEKLRSINEMLRSGRVMLWSNLRRSKLGIGMHNGRYKNKVLCNNNSQNGDSVAFGKLGVQVGYTLAGHIASVRCSSFGVQ
jgi:hypothetical protein